MPFACFSRRSLNFSCDSPIISICLCLKAVQVKFPHMPDMVHSRAAGMKE